MKPIPRRVAGSLAMLIGLLPTAGRGQLAADFGPRGEISRLRVGEVTYLRDIAVAVIKPGWSGKLADQREATPADVKAGVSRDTKIYTTRLAAGPGAIKLREVARVEKDAIRLDFEVTPELDADAETIVLEGIMPTEEHAGKTRYYVAGDGVEQGTCPSTLDPNSHVIFHRDQPEWAGFAAPGGGELKVIPSGLALQFQDDRRWNQPGFALLAMSGGVRLMGGQTTRFTIRYAAARAGTLEAEARSASARGPAEIPLGDRRPLAIGNVSPDRAEVDRFETVELTTDVAATYENAFDPEQLAVDAEVETPAGKRVTIPGFLDLPMRLEDARGSERVVPDGSPVFRIRYTPTAEGKHRLTVKARDRSGTVAAPPVELTARRSAAPGFIRVASHSPRSFAYEDGRSYFAVGVNLCWASGRTPIADYTAWLKGLGAAGGNWARLWLAFNEKGLEWMPTPTPKPGTGAYRGLGRYALDNAWRLDQVMRLARQNGVALMFCIGTYGEFTQGGYFNEGSWSSNPYNARNGGPCARPEDFWTDPRARKLYQQRLRYLIARWGAYPNLFAWEFWNEVPPTPAVNAWVAEMAGYVKRHDSNRHLVSTTYGDSGTWSCRDIDFTMTHRYGQAGNTANFTESIAHDAHGLRPVEKPYLLAEFGIDWQTGDEKWDRTRSGRNMHNGAWAAMMSGAAGTAMLWYWDGYVHPGNLYRVLSPVRAFADTVDWDRTRFTPIPEIQLERSEGASENFSDVTVPAGLEWGRTRSSDYSVTHDGKVHGGPVAMTIGSSGRGNPRELFSTLTWRLDLPESGTVTARIGEVCSGARLRVTLDDRVALDRVLPAGAPGKGPWKSARFLEPWKVWVANYDQDVSIEVPAGRHVLRFSNMEGDWLQVRSLTLPRYRSSRYPAAEAIGLASDQLMLLWVHNLESTWRTEHEGKQPGRLTGLQAKVPVNGDDSWDVRWWDTDRGRIVHRSTVRAVGGRLMIPVPDFHTDLAARIERPL